MKLAFFGWWGLKSIKSFGSTASDWANIMIIIGSEMMSNFFSFEGERDER